MRVSQWARSTFALPELQEPLAHLEGRVAWRSIALEARPFVLAAWYQAQPRKVLLIAPTYERALQWHAKLVLCGVSEADLRMLPSGISQLFEDAAPEAIALSDRIGSLRSLVEPGQGIVIGTPQAVLERTLPRDLLEEAFVDLELRMKRDPSELIGLLKLLGYEPAEPVRAPGQYSKRGGILDVFAVGHASPTRIEWFDDEIESLRKFDPNSQRSLGTTQRLTLAPSRETLFNLPGVRDAQSPEEEAQAREGFREMLERAVQLEAASLTEEAAKTLEETIAGDIKAIQAGVFFDRLDLYRPMLHPDSGCAIDLLPEDGYLVLDEPVELDALAARAEEELASALEHRAERGEILHSTVNDYVLPPEHLGSPERVVALSSMGTMPQWLGSAHEVEIDIASMEPYRGRSEVLAQTIRNWTDQKFCVVLGTDQPTRARAVLSQIELFPREAPEESKDGELPDGLFIAQGNLAGGFVSPDLKFALVTDMELFGVGRLKLPQRRFNDGVPVATVLDLKEGDYVVHINFGIGIFRGLVTRKVDGIDKEFLFLEYATPDKLYVPADQLDRIQKYLNPGDTEPKLNRLTGGEWQRAVGKAREEAREFARDLIKLYAQRIRVQRTPYGPDSPWQAEMEQTFPWQETPSQMTAIREAKADLQLEYPMDRLVCGDVGFGKTEVAIRAAFKVAQAGKQVAVLCPTTILSEQHYRNFDERLGAFPIKIDYLNRFRSTAERKDVIARLEKGDIDVIIGTHALLASELKFKDLGLMVIDEEQKFGVKQKEALKKLRVSVDVLTLSATPIPRTLSMALMDIRQMSLINDPPPGRLPIRTFLRPYSAEVIREALLRELARGGQVYYVFNKVTGIYHIAEKLRKLIPSARIAVGHGQMTEKELEPVMLGFIKGEVDILLSTTIVENGLDIPNANTLIVENADLLGLAQLYQLRGRVGRSDRQAYAYLLYQNERSLTENAMARLQSLQEFSSLGSGYSLAFRDLQIRGAGELLGSKQSGTMATVGYELFTQLISEEVQFLKSHADGDDPREYKDPFEGLAALPTVDLPVSARIPDDYVTDQAQRLYCYKQMMSARTSEELTGAENEVRDRYGRFPEEVERAFAIMRLRMLARSMHITKIDGNGGRLAVTFNDNADLSPKLFATLTKRNRQSYVNRQSYIWPFGGDPITACATMLDTLHRTLSELEEQRASLGV